MDEGEKGFLVGNSTKDGEFISSFHMWLPIEEQKNKAKEMENMTGGTEYN